MSKTTKTTEADNTVELSDGTTVTWRNATGHDLVQARRVTSSDPFLMTFALIAQVCEFGGQPRTIEDLLDLPMDDCLLLENRITGNGR